MIFLRANLGHQKKMYGNAGLMSLLSTSLWSCIVNHQLIITKSKVEFYINRHKWTPHKPIACDTCLPPLATKSGVGLV